MTDDATTTAVSAEATPDAIPATAAAAVTAAAPASDEAAARRCPWCSELMPADATVRCPHCNANLVAEGETRLPGLIEVETPSANMARRIDPPKRSKLLSWISGDIEDESFSPVGGKTAPDAVGLPPRDVRREMLRLQLEAEGLTVGADGSIAYPVSAKPATDETADATAASADAVIESDVESNSEICKAS